MTGLGVKKNPPRNGNSIGDGADGNVYASTSVTNSIPQTGHDFNAVFDVHMLNGVKGRDGKYTARCPAHDDRVNSLSITVTGDKTLLHCHAGCPTENIVSALGLPMSSLFMEDKPTYTAKRRQTNEITYDYQNPDGSIAYRKKRYEYDDRTKTFAFYRPDGSKGVAGVKRVPYNLPAVLKAQTVYFVEGEKCVQAVNKAGRVATTLDAGANSKWQAEYADYFKGKTVFIIPDNDTAGNNYAQLIAAQLPGSRILQLPGLTDKGDIYDWLAAGHAITEIDGLHGEEWKTETENTEPSPALVRASDIPYEPPRWLLSPYFQRGKGTLIQADNGIGKTAFMCAVAAHVSTGKPILGMDIITPGDVLILSVEDDLPVLRGRIEENGGDLHKCHFITNGAGLTFNNSYIETAIKQVKARLVIFDPFQAFLGAGVNMDKSNQTRPELAKLFETADRNDCAIAIIAHIGKGSLFSSAVNRSLGSVDIPASMRSILHLTRNPENEDECVAVHVKCSNAPKGQSIAFRIGNRGGIQWNGFSSMTAEDLNVIVKRTEKGIPYENEPLVQVFNQLITDKPGGGFFSYAVIKETGMKILGFPPYSTTADLKSKLDGSLARELQEKDGIIVTCGHKQNNVRGLRIEQYQQPKGYQIKLGVDD